MRGENVKFTYTYYKSLNKEENQVQGNNTQETED